MGKEKMFGFLMVVVSILSVAFLLQMMMTEADPDNPKWARWRGIYYFPDDSICPCSSNRFFASQECNEEIDRLLDYGYQEVRFCERER